MSKTFFAVVLGLIFVFPTIRIAGAAVPLAPVFVLAMLDRAMRAQDSLRLLDRGVLALAALLVFISLAHALVWQSAGMAVATAQLIASILLALWLVVRWDLALGAARTERLRRWLVWAAGLLLVLALVEVLVDFSPIYRITDPWLHSGAPIATNLEREIAIAGFVRPRLFTSEPSHFAKNFLLVTVAAALVSPAQRQLLQVAALLCGGLVVLRSPIVAAGFLVVALQLLLHRGVRLPRAVTVVAVAAVAMVVAAHAFADRWTLLRTGRDLSAFVRIEAPLALTMETLRSHPLFGVGLGNDRYVIARASEIHERRGLQIRHDAGININNGYATAAISLGVIGTALYLAFIGFLLRRIAGRLPAAYWVYALTLPMLLGAVFSPRFWIFLVLPALVYRRTAVSQAPVRPPRRAGS